MTKLALALLLIVTLGCDENTIGYVSKDKYDALDRELAATKDQLAVARQQVSNCNRFQTVKAGWQTWRLDTMTGQTCLLLAPEAQWKNQKLSAASCNQ